MSYVDKILSEDHGHRAIALANEAVDDSPELKYDVREALYSRLYKKVGPKAFEYSPRVATIWYDFKATPRLKLAAILLALSQDQSYPCEKEWEERLVTSDRVLSQWSEREVDSALIILLSNVFYAKVVGGDFRKADYYISKIIKDTAKQDENNIPLPRKASQISRETYVPETKGIEKHERWLSLFRRNNG